MAMFKSVLKRATLAPSRLVTPPPTEPNEPAPSSFAITTGARAGSANEPVEVPKWWRPDAVADVPRRNGWVMPDVEPVKITTEMLRKGTAASRDSLAAIKPMRPVAYPLTSEPIQGAGDPEEPVWAVWLGSDHDSVPLRDLAMDEASGWVATVSLHAWGGGWLGVMTETAARLLAAQHAWDVRTGTPSESARAVAFYKSAMLARATNAVGHVTGWSRTWLGHDGLIYPTRSYVEETLPSKWPLDDALRTWVQIKADAA